MYFITVTPNETDPIQLYKCETLRKALQTFYKICKENNYEYYEDDVLPRIKPMQEYDVVIYKH